MNSRFLRNILCGSLMVGALPLTALAQDEGAEGEGLEGVGVPLMAEPVFAAALAAFQTAHHVGCILVDGAVLDAQEPGASATFTATFSCSVNEGASGDAWSVTAMGTANETGFTVLSINFMVAGDE